MKRIEYSSYGGPERMRLADAVVDAPGADEVRVRVRAAAINPVDWKVRRGDMKMMTGRSFPRAMGQEFAGVVESVGRAVTRFKPGDEVFGTVGLKASGAFAGQVVTSQDLLAHKPAAVSFEQAACLSVAPLTAWRGLVDKAHLAAGQAVFVAGCGGAVGRAAVQLAKVLRGASVAGSCGAGDLDAARAMGVEPVLDYARGDLSALAARFDVVFDTAGQLSIAQGLALLKPGRGLLLDINFTPVRMLRGLLAPRYKILMGTPSVALLEAVGRAAADGILQIEIGRSAPLQEAIALVTDFEQGRKGKGRSVITMG